MSSRVFAVLGDDPLACCNTTVNSDVNSGILVLPCLGLLKSHIQHDTVHPKAVKSQKCRMDLCLQ